ncbi:MAG: diguanylate cyclase [Gammaproteobacteria bacterium]|nr:diguanylate cyclase [Gammaproteobacteria bacterium]
MSTTASPLDAPELLRSVIDAAPEGIVICARSGSDSPVIYVNAAFERMSGYPAAELLGRDLRLLQGADRDQEGRAHLQAALARGESCRVLLRNYRKDGSQYWNEIFLEPVRGGDSAITHVVGFHRDISERSRMLARPATGLPTWMREDRLTGLASRAYFEELLQHDWGVGEREGRMLTLMMFDIDALHAYNETYGRAAGDACIRRIAGVIGAAFRRGADIVARWEGGCLCALVRNSDAAAIPAFADAIAQRAAGQHIHHPRSTRQRFVTVSVGVASLNPGGGRQPEALVHAVQAALKRAKQNRDACVAVAGPEDFPS